MQISYENLCVLFMNVTVCDSSSESFSSFRDAVKILKAKTTNLYELIMVEEDKTSVRFRNEILNEIWDDFLETTTTTMIKEEEGRFALLCR